MIACTPRFGQASRSSLARLAAVIALTVTIIVAPSFALTTIALADDVATAGSGQQDDHAATAGDSQADQAGQLVSPGEAQTTPEGVLTLTDSIAPVGTEDSPSDADLGATPPDQPLCSDTSGVGDTSQGSGQNQPTVENDTSEAAEAASHTISGEYETAESNGVNGSHATQQATTSDTSEPSPSASSTSSLANSADTDVNSSDAAFGFADPSTVSDTALTAVGDPFAYASESGNDQPDSTISINPSSDAILASTTPTDTLSASSTVTYRVEYWLQQTDGLFTLENTVTHNGAIGQVISRDSVVYSDATPGYVGNQAFFVSREPYLDRRPNLTKTAESFTVTADEMTNVYRIYWDLSTKHYVFEYDENTPADVSISAEELATWETFTYFGCNTMHIPNKTPTSASKPNWKFKGWREYSNNWCDGELHSPGSSWGTMWVRLSDRVHITWPTDKGGVEGRLVAEWYYDPPKATYTIQHFQQDLDGTYPTTPYETEKDTILLGATTNASSFINSYIGFTYNPDVPGSTIGAVTPLEDGSTILNLYYERNNYSVTYEYDETTGGPAPIPVPAGLNGVPFGATVTAETLTYPEENVFDGWSLSYSEAGVVQTIKVLQGSTFVMPSCDVVLTGIWDRKTWEVTFDPGESTFKDSYGYEYSTGTITGKTYQTGIVDGGHCVYGPGEVEVTVYIPWQVKLLWFEYTLGEGESQQKYTTCQPSSIEVHQDITFVAIWGSNKSIIYDPGDHGDFQPNVLGETYFDESYIYTSDPAHPTWLVANVPDYNGPKDADSLPLGKPGWKFIGWDWTVSEVDWDSGNTSGAYSYIDTKYTWRYNGSNSWSNDKPSFYDFIKREGTFSAFIAQWEPLPQTLIYHPTGPVEGDLTKTLTGTWSDGGTGLETDTRSEAHNCGDIFDLRDKGSITLAGYSLIAWNDKADGSGRIYPAGGKFEMPGTEMHLWPVWRENLIDIRYAVASGSSGMGSVDRTTDRNVRRGSGTVILGSTPVPEVGYVFVRWTLEDESAVISGVSTTTGMLTPTAASDGTDDGLWEGVTYYAEFMPKLYTLHYLDEDEATTLIADRTGVKWRDINLTPEPTKEGYKFTGWYYKTDPSGGISGSWFKTLTAAAYSSTPFSEIDLEDENSLEATIYATWIQDHIVLTYEPDDASHGAVSLASETIAVGSGTPAGSLATANPGWRFVRWERKAPETAGNTIKDASARWVKLEKSGDLWLADAYVAIFEEIPVVLTYEPDDATHGSVSLASETIGSATGTPAGSTATAKTGWRFVRWERKAPQTAGNAIVNPTSAKVSLAKSGALWLSDAYVAIFEEIPVVLTYEPDDASHGAVSLASETVAAGSGTPAGSLASAKDGWRFVRWERKAPQTAGNAIVDASAAKVELAKAGSLWVSDAYVAIFEEAPDYAILYDGNGADSGVPDDQTGLTFEDKGALRDPARRGYAFDGWFRSLDGRRKGEGDPMSDMQPVYSGLANEDRSIYSVTLHASWTPITYVVSFHPNGGVGQMDDQGFTYDVSDELDRNLFTYAGWRFAGWTDVDPGLSGQADAQKSHVTGNHYSDEQTVSNLAYIQDEVVDLWALWEREEGTEGGGTEGPGPEGGETDGPEGGETDGPGTKGQGTDDPEGIDSGDADEDATDTRGSDDGTDAKDTDAKSARTDAESGNGAGTGTAGSATAAADGGEGYPARSASAVHALASTSASRGATLAQTGDARIPLGAFALAGMLVLGLGLLARKDGWR